MGVPRTWEQSLTESQERNGDLGSITTRNWSFPTTWMLPRASESNPTLPTPWFQPVTPRARNTTTMPCQTSDLQNCELITGIALSCWKYGKLLCSHRKWTQLLKVYFGKQISSRAISIRCNRFFERILLSLGYFPSFLSYVRSLYFAFWDFLKHATPYVTTK